MAQQTISKKETVQTAVEKAEELVRKFKPFVQFKMGVEQSYVLRMAKQCALVTVDEIVNLSKISSLRRDEVYMELEYWMEVKQEIEKL